LLCFFRFEAKQQISDAIEENARRKEAKQNETNKRSERSNAKQSEKNKAKHERTLKEKMESFFSVSEPRPQSFQDF
jgi:biopolymer transport protein ExbB/TolQ